ncbi:MAG TPA: MFS transporter [Stellaceae bacterium]|nr:MFS transporter [Stellaceae bacterium]
MSQNAETMAPARAGQRRFGTSYGWYVVAVLVVAYAFSFLDRQILSLLVEPIKHDLDLDDTEVSLLQGFAFALFLALGGVPIGRWVDSGRRVTIVAAGIASWSLMTAGCGLASGFAMLLLCRIGVGVGEAALTPSAYSLIGDCVPPSRMGLAIGIFNIGVYLGIGLALILGGAVIAGLGHASLTLPYVGSLHGWQLTFLAVGLPGLLVSLWVASLSEPERRGRAATVPMAQVRAYFRTNAATLACLYLALACTAFMSYAYNAWVPSFLIRTFHWSVAEAGRSYGLSVLAAGTAGVLVGGVLGDFVSARRPDGNRMTLLAGTAIIGAGFTAIAPLMPDGRLALVLVACATFCSTVIISTAPAALQEMMPARMRGVAAAWGVLIVNLIGLGLGPTAIALVTDYVIGDERQIRYALATVPALALLASAGFAWAGRRPFLDSRRSFVQFDRSIST